MLNFQLRIAAFAALFSLSRPLLKSGRLKEKPLLTAGANNL
jgi:hypothetical protein